MKIPVVMTIIGPDQPGLVEALSSLIISHQGNWEESRMARLAGQFAGILQVKLDQDQLEAFQSKLESLGKSGLKVILAPTQSSPPKIDKGGQVGLEIVGNDQEGIVNRISRVLAGHQVNVESFESNCESAPWTGATLFRAKAQLSIPSQVNVEALRADLEQLADELMVDLALNQKLQA